MSVRLCIVYYSSTGTIHRIAQTMVDEAEALGATVRLRRVQELAPPAVVAKSTAWSTHLESTKHIPYATQDDILWADAVMFGTPTRFGNICSQLKQFIDTLGGAWYSGQLTEKAYGAFTSGGSMHAGMETTLASMNTMFCHFGGVIVPPAITDPALTTAGNPYGTSHVIGGPDGPVEENTGVRSRMHVRRVLAVAEALGAARAATGQSEAA